MRNYPCGATASGSDVMPVNCPIHGESCASPLPDNNWHSIVGPNGMCKCGSEETCGDILRRQNAAVEHLRIENAELLATIEQFENERIRQKDSR